MMSPMETRIVIVRDRPVRDLIFLAREAADLLRDRPDVDALVRCLDGATAEVARELSLAPVDPEPATPVG